MCSMPRQRGECDPRAGAPWCARFTQVGIGAAPSFGPSMTRQLFLSSKAGSSSGAAAGSKDHLLWAQGHGRERPPAQLAVRARVVKEMESTEEGHCVTLDELRTLREEVTGRLEVLGPGEAARAFVDVACSIFFVLNIVFSSL